LISESDLTGTDSISQLKMSTGSGTSSALTGGVQGKTRYANMIKAMIANKNTYPKASRKRGETGTVVIQVSISHLGSLIEVKVVKSSGKKRLDRASIKAVKRAAPFPASSSLVKGELFISRMPIEYKLH
jgi:protein TonB